MNNVTRIRAIDRHTDGEPTRVVIDGFHDPGDGPMSERLEIQVRQGVSKRVRRSF